MARVPGEYTYTRRGEILRCPWHGWEFDVKTGQSWFDPQQTRVRAYPVTVETVEAAERVASGEAAGAGLPEALEKGPYVAETYDVTLENRAEKQVIVIEIP
jgi:3-phenylpropionate/trans-cinnamate dioxygenase ferredoxin subunit